MSKETKNSNQAAASPVDALVIGTERLLDALLCVEFIAMHQEELPKNLNTEKERELHAALDKIYRISHVARKPVCFDKHENWEKEFQHFIPVAKG